VTIDASAFPLSGARARIEYAGAAEGTVPTVELLVVRVADGQAAGRLVLEQSETALTVLALCIDREFRSFGLGSECGALVRKFAERGPWRLLRASAAPDLGLSAYFWMRMGLHPLHGEGPYGGIWYERRLR
jgi:hypothetical protein